MRPSLLLVVVLAGIALAGEYAPWLDEVASQADKAMLAALLDEDEAQRKAATERWERERSAFMHKYGFPGWPRDELDPEEPRHAFEVRKVKVTNGLVRALKDGPPLVRRAACRSIADLGPAFRHGREAVGRAIDDADPRVRAAAIQALCDLRPFEGGRKVCDYLPGIVEHLLDPAFEARKRAMEAVAYLLNSEAGHNEMVRAAIPRLVESTKAETADLRVAAYGAIGSVAPRQPRTALILRHGLDDEDADVRRVAAGRLVYAMRWRESEEVLGAAPRLRELLTDAQFTVRWAAANALWEITKDAQGLVPICAEALGRFDGLELAHACGLICRIGPEAGPTAPALVTRLGKVPPMRHLTTGSEPYHALLSVGPELKDVRSAITTRLTSKDPEERHQAMRALETVHATPDAIADLVLAHLETERDASVRVGALSALAARAPQRAQVFVAELCRQARSGDEESHPWVAVGLLGRIGSPEAIACVGECLGDTAGGSGAWRALLEAGVHAAPALEAIVEFLGKDPEHAVALFASMGTGAAPAVPRLLEFLPEASARALPDLCEAIRQGGGDAAPCVKALLPLLDRTEADDVQTRAIRALGRFGKAAAKALPKLERIRDETEVFDRDGVAAAVAAARMGGSRSKAIERCIYGVRNASPPDEDAIRDVLPILGPADAEAVPDLVKAALYWREAFHKQPERTLLALEALGRIGEPAREALPVVRSLGRNVLFQEAADEAARRITAN